MTGAQINLARSRVSGGTGPEAETEAEAQPAPEGQTTRGGLGDGAEAAGPSVSEGRPEGAPDDLIAEGLRRLLASDERVFRAKDETELAQLIVNEARQILGARQVFLVERRRGGLLAVVAVSSLALVDRDTPVVRWIEQMAGRLDRAGGAAPSEVFALPAFADPDSDETASYPFRHFMWHTLELDKERAIGAVIATRDQPWGGGDVSVLAREARIYATAWAAQRGRRSFRPRRRVTRWWPVAAGVLLIAAGLIPVPLTTLAPVEIVAAEPEIVAAPIDGVIRDLPVAPNQMVSAGTVLLHYDDTVTRNRLELAEREVRVARAKFERAERAALSDITARHELLIARAEFKLKQAERDYAASLQAQSVVRAVRDGLLIYGARDEWIGRPVKTGEKIMSVARTEMVEARIELPVADAIALRKGAKVRLFLDAQPLEPRRATVVRESYHAKPDSSDQLSYTLHARLAEPAEGEPGQAPAGAIDIPRIGSRGTAQVFGATVPLAFFLFRRPISFMRQTFGL